MKAWPKQIRSTFRYITALSLLLVLAMVPTVSADSCPTNPGQQSCSGNYGVSETFFGTGGELNSCSATYCSKQSAGETAVGNTKSGNYQAQAGFNTDRVPSLTFVVNGGALTDLGKLTPGVTAHANSTFFVKSYLSSGYVVQAYGLATNGGHALTPMTTAGPSNANAEQFGINLVANTSPLTFGANPSQAPDATFGFGQAASGYNTVNTYKYHEGDVIARSLTSTGETDYTISYIFNTTNLTPGGRYLLAQALVATATF